MSPTDFAFIAAFLKERSGLIVTPDKTYLLESRLVPLGRKYGLAGLAALIDALKTGAQIRLADEVVDAMTTNETSFFRDKNPFDQLRKAIVPQMMELRSSARALRIWSAACSTGQEPYSLAMMLRDEFPALASWKIDIVATDISPSVLDRARDGTYSTFEVQRGLPIQLLVKHFDQIGENWRIKPELRRMIDFRSANLLTEMGHLGLFDVVLCRNVLIYFDQPTKAKILEAISRRLAPHGALILGGAESVFGLCDRLGNFPGLRGVYCRGTPALTPKPAAQSAPVRIAS